MSENTSKQTIGAATAQVPSGINTVSDIKDALNLLDELKNKNTHVQGSLFSDKSTKIDGFFNYDEKKILLYSIFEQMINDAAKSFGVSPHSLIFDKPEIQPISQVVDKNGNVVRDSLKEHTIVTADEVSTPDFTQGNITKPSNTEEGKTITLPRTKEAQQKQQTIEAKEKAMKFDGEALTNSIKNINDLIVTIYDSLDNGTADDVAVVRRVAIALLSKVVNDKPYLEGNGTITSVEDAEKWYNGIAEARTKSNQQKLELTSLNGEEVKQITDLVSKGEIDEAKQLVRYLIKTAGVDHKSANATLEKILAEHTPKVSTEIDTSFQFPASDIELINKSFKSGGAQDAIKTAKYCAKKLNFDNTIVIRRRVLDIIKEANPKVKTSATKEDITAIKAQISELVKTKGIEETEKFAEEALTKAGWAAKNIKNYLSHVFAKLVSSNEKEENITSEKEIAENVAISQITSMTEYQLKEHTVKLLRENLLNEAISDVTVYGRKKGWDDNDTQLFIEECKSKVFPSDSETKNWNEKKVRDWNVLWENQLKLKKSEALTKQLSNPKTSQTKMKRALGELLKVEKDQDKVFNVVWKHYEKKSDWNEKKVRDWIKQVQSNVKTA
jgi:hypothetical protein